MGSSLDSIRDDEDEERRKRYNAKFLKDAAKAEEDLLKKKEGLSLGFKFFISTDYDKAKYLFDNREKIFRNKALIDLLG